MTYVCALCPATCDGRGFMFGDWRVLNVNGKAYPVCPDHWPTDRRYEAWTEAYQRNFEELRKLAPAGAVAAK